MNVTTKVILIVPLIFCIIYLTVNWFKYVIRQMEKEDAQRDTERNEYMIDMFNFYRTPFITYRRLCKAVADKLNAELLFINDNDWSFGLRYSDDHLQHVYRDELKAFLEDNDDFYEDIIIKLSPK